MRQHGFVIEEVMMFGSFASMVVDPFLSSAAYSLFL